MNDERMKISERVYHLRKEKRLSQGELASLLDVSRQSVSKWETAVSLPELENLVKMSEIFGVSVDDIINYNLAQEEVKLITTPQSKSVRYIGIALAFIALVIALLVDDSLGGIVLFVAVFLIAYKSGNALHNVWVLFWEFYIFSMPYGSGSFGGLLIGIQLMMSDFQPTNIIPMSVTSSALIFFVVMAVWSYRVERSSKAQRLISITTKYFISNLIQTLPLLLNGFYFYNGILNGLRTCASMTIPIAFVVLYFVFKKKNITTPKSQIWFIGLGIAYLLPTLWSLPMLLFHIDFEIMLLFTMHIGTLVLAVIRITLLVILVLCAVKKILVRKSVIK